MKRTLKTAALAMAGALALPALAGAQSGAVATSDLNMRTGPGVQHALVGVIPANAPVTVHQCTSQGTWCQVSYGSHTAWSYSPYLASDTAAVAGEPMHDRIVIAGPEPASRTGFPFGTTAGIAGGALAGGLLGGPPGAIVGGTVGAAAGAGATATDRPGLPDYQTR